MGITTTMAGDVKQTLTKLLQTAERRAVTKSARVVRKEARTLAPRETGSLKKSLNFVVRSYAQGGETKKAVGIVGPEKDFKVKIPDRVTGGPKRGKGRGKRAHIPQNYSHLVELGTRRSKAKPFLEPARLGNEKAVLTIFSQEFKTEIDKIR